MTFTTLIFGLCAWVEAYGTQDLVNIGYMSQGKCISHFAVADMKPGESLSFGEHTITVHIIVDGDADIGVDDRHFVIIKGVRA